MRIEYIDPFVESAIHILNITVSKEVTKGEITLRTFVTPMLGVALIVGLAGQVSGRVIVNMSKETALAIASIMNNEKMEEFDELTSSTLCELANMITGRAITKLYDLGYKFDITPPAMLTGENLKISDNKLEALIVPLQLPQGKIEINVALKEDV
ncbi:MAG: chemotaxis protein CheX [Spirochaetes bacterium]|nr:chemotaxis protein CheX [Spirochaetota bacterium]